MTLRTLLFPCPSPPSSSIFYLLFSSTFILSISLSVLPFSLLLFYFSETLKLSRRIRYIKSPLKRDADHDNKRIRLSYSSSSKEQEIQSNARIIGLSENGLAHDYPSIEGFKRSEPSLCFRSIWFSSLVSLLCNDPLFRAENKSTQRIYLKRKYSWNTAKTFKFLFTLLFLSMVAYPSPS